MLLCPGITATPGVQGGAPCFAGTRLPVRIVAAIAERHGYGLTRRTYPQLTVEQVTLALAFSAGMKYVDRQPE